VLRFNGDGASVREMATRRSGSIVQDRGRPSDAVVVLLRMGRSLDYGKKQKLDNLFHEIGICAIPSSVAGSSRRRVSRAERTKDEVCEFDVLHIA